MAKEGVVNRGILVALGLLNLFFVALNIYAIAQEGWWVNWVVLILNSVAAGACFGAATEVES